MRYHVRMTFYRRIFLALVLLGIALTAYMYYSATRDPVVRTLRIEQASMPADMPLQRIVLLSDVHVAGPDMPPERVARIVAQVNALQPDLVLIAGDFVSDKTVATHIYPADQGLAPLAKLKARQGVYAVLGNHDYWRGADRPDDTPIKDVLTKLGIRVLNNEAVQAGPYIIGGVDDDHIGRADVARVLSDMTERQYESDFNLSLPRAAMHIILSHSPDIFPRIPAPGSDQRAALVLTGHTHCGQIAAPLIGPIFTASKYGRRYACGVVRENGKTLVVGAGLGTSILPLRWGAVPDFWLIEVRGTLQSKI